MKTISRDYWRERIRNTHPRTRKAQINTIFGLFVKGGGMIISLLLVPMTIDYLSATTYGTWLTISSIITMLTFLDIGIGNGLRNKLSEAVANQESTLARIYVSTAYSVFGAIQIGIISLFFLIVRYVPWQRVFNTGIDTKQLQLVVLITAVAMTVKLVLDILSYVLFALQESGRVGFITFLSNALTLIGTYLLTKFTTGNLVYLAIVSATSPIIVLLLSSIYLYRNKLHPYRPDFQLASRKYTRSLLSLGYKFFIIQLAVVIIFYTDNLIITQLFGPAEVTTYNVAFRYFNAISIVFMIAITPYWSAFTEAFFTNDTAWIARTYFYLQKLWLGLTLLIIVMVFAADTVYAVWLGNRVMVPHLLNGCMGLFVAVSCWNNITVAVVNGVGKIKLQLYYSLVSATANVPLAIFFGHRLNMGSAGVILATVVSISIGSVLSTMQARKLISGTAKGIWNQ
jgi:O-antigen/teichoic acid export membrane protein